MRTCKGAAAPKARDLDPAGRSDSRTQAEGAHIGAEAIWSERVSDEAVTVESEEGSTQRWGAAQGARGEAECTFGLEIEGPALPAWVGESEHPPPAMGRSVEMDMRVWEGTHLQMQTQASALGSRYMPGAHSEVG